MSDGGAGTSSGTSNARRLTVRLRDCLQRLIPLLHATPSTTTNPAVPVTVSVNQDNHYAVALCDTLEAIFMHGIKIKEFNGVPLWGFLERLEILIPPCIPLRNTVGAVASIGALRTPIAKARAWVRQILNDGHIDEAVMFMMSQNELLRAFYSPGALLLSAEEGTALMAVLRSIKALKFSFTIENDASLQEVPKWLEATIHSALTLQSTIPVRTETGSNSSSQNINNGNTNSNNSTGTLGFGLGLGSFLKSMETSLDKLAVRVDAAADLAAKFINEQLEQQQSSSGTGTTGDSAVPLMSSLLLGGGGQGGVRRITPFFGSTLKELLLDERRTSHAYLNPLLGIPNQAARMISFISARANTSDLFRRPVPTPALMALRRDVEEERDFSSDTDVAAVALLLMQWLNQLPEPLLGYEHYTAILACAELDDPAARVRNMALLVQEASWFAKPLLVRLVGLLHRCIQPEFAAQNNLNVIAVAVLSTPCLLRPYVPALHSTPMSFFQENEARERMQMAATATGSSTVEFLISNQGGVLQRLREDLAQREAALSAKCTRIARLQEATKEGVDTMFPEYIDEDTQALIRELWGLLELADCPPVSPAISPLPNPPTAENNGSKGGSLMEECTTDSASVTPSRAPSQTSTQTLALQDVLSDARWVRCGFLPAELPLRSFNVPYGFLALKYFTGFMKGYHKQAAAMVKEYCQQQRGDCTLPAVVLQLTKFMIDVLRILPTTISSSNSNRPSGNAVVEQSLTATATSMQLLAKQPSWLLLNDERCPQELFDVLMLSFEDTWKAGVARISGNTGMSTGSLSTILTVSGPASRQLLSQCYSKSYGLLSEIVHKQRPRTVERVWTHWLSARLAEQERIAAAQSQQRQSSGMTSAHTTRTSSSNNMLKIEQGVAISDAAVEAAATIATTVAAITSSKSATAQTDTTSEDPVKTNPQVSVMVDEDTAWMRQPVSEDFAESEWESTDFGNSNNDKINQNDGEVAKCVSGVTTKVRGISSILSAEQIQKLEEALPTTYQCYDWDLVYRLAIDGANIPTLVNKSKGSTSFLLVVRDSAGAVFGALITEALKMGEKEKYYGNGTTAVWSFQTGELKFYPWSFKNSYFLITSKDSLAVGGGGNFAIYLDGDLNHGSSGPCLTFSSPCLASEEEFLCQSCELFAFSTALLGL